MDLGPLGSAVSREEGGPPIGGREDSVELPFGDLVPLTSIDVDSEESGPVVIGAGEVDGLAVVREEEAADRLFAGESHGALIDPVEVDRDHRGRVVSTLLVGRLCPAGTHPRVVRILAHGPQVCDPDLVGAVISVRDEEYARAVGRQHAVAFLVRALGDDVLLPIVHVV